MKLGHFLFLLLISPQLFGSELQLNRSFSDHMVLQRGKPNLIKGVAKGGAQVEVEFADQKISVSANASGKWEAQLKPMKASGQARELKVTSAEETVRLKDVLVGDVILVARQTSMNQTLEMNELGNEELERLKSSSHLRVMSLKVGRAVQPMENFSEGMTQGWKVLSEDRGLKMSSVSFHLAKKLSEEVQVPVGIVDLVMGPQFTAAWLDEESLNQSSDKVTVPIQFPKSLYHHYKNKIPMKRGNVAKLLVENPLSYGYYPASSYNGTLTPLRGFSFAAFVVQLGNNYPYYLYEALKKKGGEIDREALNLAYKDTYLFRLWGFGMEEELTPLIPKVWRQKLGDPNLPFAFIAPPSSKLKLYAQHNRDMRELQRLASEILEGVDLILPGMEAIPFSGQPKDEQLLASRIGQWLKSRVWERSDLPGRGPSFERMEVKGNQATLYFKEGTATGLKAEEGALDYFEVSDTDAVYIPAKAEIQGENILLKGEGIDRIVYVRYNYKELPNQGLMNGAGLPMIPFTTEPFVHQYKYRREEDQLPEEYHLPANEWKSKGTTIINAQMKERGYEHFSGWIGPVGVKTGPFGPNMGVKEVLLDSPAAGKLEVGDLIFSANGEMLGEEEEMTMSRAITESEATDGLLLLGVNRGGEIMEIKIQLKVMGRYSSTAPWDCPKTEQIVKDLESYIVSQNVFPGYLYSSSLFLLGAGTPEHQGVLRRNIKKKDESGSNWHTGYQAILLSEYYLANGDRSVLESLKKLVENIEGSQIKDRGNRTGGWYGKGSNDRGYPAMAHVGVSNMLALTLAKEAGIPVNEETYRLGMEYLKRKGAEVGVIIYGDAFKKEPRRIDPEKMFSGKLSTENGKVALAAVLYNIMNKQQPAHLNSLISTHSWYSTYHGHGGNFWNNLWTPLGSAVHGKKSYQHFMKHHRWYRELSRRFDGALLQDTGKRFEGGTGLALVVPRQRLRILGAPKSPFSPDAPVVLKSALEAYWSRDYPKAEALTDSILKDNALDPKDAPTVRRLFDEAQRRQEEIRIGLINIEKRLSEKKGSAASWILGGLLPIMAGDENMIQTLKKRIDPLVKEEKQRESKRKVAEREAKKKNKGKSKDKEKKTQPEPDLQVGIKDEFGTWKALTTRIGTPPKKAINLGYVDDAEATEWRYKILETRNDAPEGWMNPSFDDGTWSQTNLPLSWHINHTFIGRAKFNVTDPEAFDLLRLRSWVFRQQNMVVYLNGEAIAKLNNVVGKTGSINADLNKAALKLLRKGENTLAVATRQHWRWGMMRLRVYNNGFDILLDGRVPDPKP